MEREQEEPLVRQERFYVLVGVGGVALVGLSYALRRAALGLPAVLVHLVGALVIAAWAAAGVVATRRRAQEAREAREARERAQAEAQRKAAEAQQATERAVRTVMARRTTSHGGMTINVRRTPARDAATGAEAPDDRA